MENSELLNTVRRPLSPDSEIEIPASRSEFVRVVEILEILYDGVRQAAIVSAVPSPLHGQEEAPGLNEVIKDRLFIAADVRNARDTGRRTGPSHILMIAIEVRFAQTYASLRAAISSFSVCALRCRVGIARCINEGDRGKRPSSTYYATIEEKRAAIQDVERALRSQLQANPFGLLKMGNYTWFGIANVVLATYRLQDEATPPDTLLNPTRSFTIVDHSGFVGGQVPADLAEITLGDSIPVNLFHQDWFENSFRSSMLETAMEPVEDKCKVQRV
ncbi:hypothetical protein V1520DRAFT_393103 [Lipomyces starkeyi]